MVDVRNRLGKEQPTRGTIVLAITPDAANAINGMVSGAELPEGSGLRITTELAHDEEGQPRTGLRLSLAEGPEDGDQLIEDGPVFVEAQTAERLDDKLLDAAVSGEEVEFSLREQAEQDEQDEQDD